jgi:hypothetical protein
MPESLISSSFREATGLRDVISAPILGDRPARHRRAEGGSTSTRW